MPRIVGVDVPADKKAEISLTYIHGIGRTTARKILEAVGVDPSVKMGDLSGEVLSKIASHIEENYAVEGELRRQVAENIKRLMRIGCYRGLRHRVGLPVRGQRTRTNARTRKGPRRTVARKKGIKEISRG